MQKSFTKTRSSLLELTDLLSMKEALKELDKKINKFNYTYLKKRKEIDDLEIQYDALNKKLILWLLKYAVSCREKLRIENCNIEKKFIKENLN
ncbi:hypothetical protein [Psychrilyobacter atlanticus]|uniref:hypothetical protein n=1 Tax=Psychrilyobacter atlanticus TaxID=271091 RepID=UPI00040E0CDE|nr:hypothetical protein [Psychrilyobacter atlanticus]